MKTKTLLVIPAENYLHNETYNDLIIYYWEGENFPYWVSYANWKGRPVGDVARFHYWPEVEVWLRENVIYPNVWS